MQGLYWPSNLSWVMAQWKTAVMSLFCTKIKCNSWDNMKALPKLYTRGWQFWLNPLSLISAAARIQVQMIQEIYLRRDENHNRLGCSDSHGHFIWRLHKYHLVELRNLSMQRGSTDHASYYNGDERRYYLHLLRGRGSRPYRRNFPYKQTNGRQMD